MRKLVLLLLLLSSGCITGIKVPPTTVVHDSSLEEKATIVQLAYDVATLKLLMFQQLKEDFIAANGEEAYKAEEEKLVDLVQRRKTSLEQIYDALAKEKPSG